MIQPQYLFFLLKVSMIFNRLTYTWPRYEDFRWCQAEHQWFKPHLLSFLLADGAISSDQSAEFTFEKQPVKCRTASLCFTIVQIKPVSWIRGHAMMFSSLRTSSWSGLDLWYKIEIHITHERFWSFEQNAVLRSWPQRETDIVLKMIVNVPPSAFD